MLRKLPQMWFLGRLLMRITTLGFAGWAWLFYRNIWQAAIPAFGSPEPYLEALRWLLAKYLMAGGGLLLSWTLGYVLVRSQPRKSVQEVSRQRQVG